MYTCDERQLAKWTKDSTMFVLRLLKGTLTQVFLTNKSPSINYRRIQSDFPATLPHQFQRVYLLMLSIDCTRDIPPTSLP